jgi:hypothetical protein
MADAKIELPESANDGDLARTIKPNGLKDIKPERPSNLHCLCLSDDPLNLRFTTTASQPCTRSLTYLGK